MTSIHFAMKTLNIFNAIYQLKCVYLMMYKVDKLTALMKLNIILKIMYFCIVLSLTILQRSDYIIEQVIVCKAMYIVFHSNFGTYIVCWHRVSILDLLGPIIGITNPIMSSLLMLIQLKFLPLWEWMWRNNASLQYTPVYQLLLLTHACMFPQTESSTHISNLPAQSKQSCPFSKWVKV